ncbi:MAG: hypothetical protein ACKKMP_03120 [Candidatus Nealsonbacteria bacterium]
MPYKRFRKTLYVKKRGKWTKKKTYPSANTARTAMTRLRALESGGKKSRR